METLKSAGTYQILTPIPEMKAQLLRIEEAGRTCYQSDTGNITEESAARFIRMLLKRGHESVLEHSCMTVRFMNLSRGFTHEQVRHRLTAISQESTRYVDYAKGGDENPDLDNFSLKCIVPPHRDENETFDVVIPEGVHGWMSTASPKTMVMGIRQLRLTPAKMFAMYEAFYRALRKAGWKPEDARQFLPIGTKSEIVISANLREWRHIFFMRTSKYAHWEIRRVMCNLLTACKKILGPVFADFEETGTDANGLRYFSKMNEVP